MALGDAPLRTMALIAGLAGAGAVIGAFAYVDQLEYPGWANTSAAIERIATAQELRDFLSERQWDSSVDYIPSQQIGSRLETLIPNEVDLLTDSDFAGAPESSFRESGSATSTFDVVLGADEYSTTNIQVAGVDEPDHIKNDGTHIYIIEDEKLYIIDAQPAGSADIVYERTLEGEDYHNMFLYKDTLAVIYEDYSYDSVPIEGDERRTWSVSIPAVAMEVYDITDRTDIERTDVYTIDGLYHDARMIEGRAYIITQNNIEVNDNLPQVRHGDLAIEPEAHYFEGAGRPKHLTTISAINVEGDSLTSQTYLMGGADAIYVSQNRAYLTLEQSDSHTPKTAIHAIAIGDSFEYEASAEVDGFTLNQFSMDEYDETFRIATTARNTETWSIHNNVYVLDYDLNLVGSLEGIAPDETIYSARFVGDTLYLVTFRQIDPFFVIDLTDGKPRILGELKIPGFSDYLHPYNEDIVVGIGRDEGVKLALFDVSDFENPRVMDEVIIGSFDAWSPVSESHKAVLIDSHKRIISLPVSEPGGNGFYVYEVKDGLEKLGIVEHDSDLYMARSLYIGDYLYTLSEDYLKAGELYNPERQTATVELD